MSTPPLNRKEANDLIDRTTADCVNLIIDMRDQGGDPSDIMTALTKVNNAVMAYVIVSSDHRTTPVGVVRIMAQALKQTLPDTIERYRKLLKNGKTL
jgi:hypothetical protein